MNDKIVDIPGGMGGSICVESGQVLRVINVEGEQIADFVCLAKKNINERSSTAETINFNNWNIYPRVGTQLYSNRGRPMMTIVEDTSAGTHDLLYACCSAPFYEKLFNAPGHRNCHDNIVQALQIYGMRDDELPNPMNLFQHTRPDMQGVVDIKLPATKAGQYVDLRAEMDVIVGVSACPYDIEPYGGSGWKPRPIRLQIV